LALIISVAAIKLFPELHLLAFYLFSQRALKLPTHLCQDCMLTVVIIGLRKRA